ncbi:Uncharacterized protein LW94_14427 [Fusarium fujikuroi]|nr:Uncharacterized protein LW94_14427 [Fusarium fujikuroi]KLP08467.1 Uncharacterized protein Y057_13814 [Fusarium fujikuroi]
MKEGKRYKIGLDLLDTRLLWTAFCVRYEFRVTVYSVSNALAACNNPETDLSIFPCQRIQSTSRCTKNICRTHNKVKGCSRCKTLTQRPVKCPVKCHSAEAYRANLNSSSTQYIPTFSHIQIVASLQVSFFQGAMPRQVLKPCPMKGNERQEVSHEASIFGQTLRLGENNHNR